MSPDPYGQYYSPYLAMGNNPITQVDPDGGKSKKDDVVITGYEKQAGFLELQKSVNGHVKLTMNAQGKVSYERIGEGPLCDGVTKLVSAIEGHSIITEVNLQII